MAFTVCFRVFLMNFTAIKSYKVVLFMAFYGMAMAIKMIFLENL
jgi:hypothetical protein